MIKYANGQSRKCFGLAENIRGNPNGSADLAPEEDIEVKKLLFFLIEDLSKVN